MYARLVAVVSTACIALSVAAGAQDCSQFNSLHNFIEEPVHYDLGYLEHITGSHQFLAQAYASCRYTGAAGTACTTQCNADVYGNYTEAGTITNSFYYHYGGWQHHSGVSAAPNANTTTCTAEAAAAFRSCTKAFGCSVIVSINATSQGFGATFTFPPDAIFSPIHSFQGWSCPGLTAPPANIPPPPCFPTGPQPPAEGNQCPTWSTSSCSWIWQQCQNGGGSSPIIIDTDGKGFHLTSAANGVQFDFYGVGKPIQIAWTEKGSTNGWLVLDRNNNGWIDSAQEMFGNISPQIQSANPNGFLALALYDLPNMGGNGDGMIDVHDAIWPKLRVWIDSNHDGISQPGELYLLDTIGIHSIDLKYTEARRTDAFGNQFRYRGRLNPDRGDAVGRVIFDVFLQAVGAGSGNQLLSASTQIR